jgi:hypothetical protein
MYKTWAFRVAVTGAVVALLVYLIPVGSLDFWRTSGLLVTALGQTAFVALYATFPWWRRFLGRALFFKAVALAALADVAITGRIYDWRYEEQTFILLYWMLGIGVWAQFAAFLRVRLKKRQNSVSGNGVSR